MKPVNYRIEDIKKLILRGLKRTHDFSIGDIVYLRFDYGTLQSEDELEVVRIEDGQYFCRVLRSYGMYNGKAHYESVFNFHHLNNSFFLKRDLGHTIFTTPLWL